MIKEDPKSAEIIRPIVRGRDIKQYYYKFDDKFLIATFPSMRYKIDDFPAINKFLLGFKPKLEQTGKKLSKNEIDSVISHGLKNGILIEKRDLEKSRKRTSNKWFETQDSIAYWKDFYKQKIVWKAVGRNLSFSILEEGKFLSAPASFMTSNENYFLLGFLSSSFAKYFIYNNSDTTGARDIMLNIQSIEKIPIPSKNIDKNFISSLVQKILNSLNSHKEFCLLTKEIDNQIYKAYDFSKEETEFIESV